MKSLFSRFFSLISAGEGAIRTGIFSSNLCFPGSFLWFQTGKRRFVPGIFHQIFVFPVLFFGFRRGRGDSYRESFIKSLFSRFVSLISADEGAIRTGNFSSNLCFPGLFLWFQLAKGRFVPGFDYEILLFPVCFGGFTLLPLSYFIS